MPEPSKKTDTDGRITLNHQGCTSLTFDTQEEYTAWERAYLRCTLFNGARVCFVKHPPEAPCSKKRENRKS
jgi:hypothetical protein